MARVVGGLFSLVAQGDLGGLLTFQKRKGSPTVYFHSEPGSLVKSHAVPTTGQVWLRAYYWDAVSHWHDLTDEQRQLWRDFVEGL